MFGGYSESNSQKAITTNIISINLDTKTVTKCNAVLPIANYDMGVSNLGNYIYLSGGNKTSQIVYRYDTVNATIEQVNVTLEHARTACATFFNGTELYLLGSNAIVDKLQIQKQEMERELLTFLGINNTLEKKERLIVDETNSNNQFIKMASDIGCKQRKLACEQMNQMFGLNVKVIETPDEFQEEVIDDGELYNGNSLNDR